MILDATALVLLTVFLEPAHLTYVLQTAQDHLLVNIAIVKQILIAPQVCAKTICV